MFSAQPIGLSTSYSKITRKLHDTCIFLYCNTIYRYNIKKTYVAMLCT